MMAVGACSALGSPVIGCYMNPDKRFAFVEFRSVEEASNAMAFDGVTCQVCAAAQLPVFLRMYVCIYCNSPECQSLHMLRTALHAGHCVAQVVRLCLHITCVGILHATSPPSVGPFRFNYTLCDAQHDSLAPAQPAVF
jgi:hypothetical protein